MRILNAYGQRMSDTAVTTIKEDVQDLSHWSNRSWVEKARVELEQQVVLSNLQIKSAAVKELIKKLEAQDMYDLR